MTIQDDKTYIQDNMAIHNADCMEVMAAAAHYANMHFVGCELDEEYYKAAIDRIRKETRQQEFEF